MLNRSNSSSADNNTRPFITSINEPIFIVNNFFEEVELGQEEGDTNTTVPPPVTDFLDMLFGTHCIPGETENLDEINQAEPIVDDPIDDPPINSDGLFDFQHRYPYYPFRDEMLMESILFLHQEMNGFRKMISRKVYCILSVWQNWL